MRHKILRSNEWHDFHRPDIIKPIYKSELRKAARLAADFIRERQSNPYARLGSVDEVQREIGRLVPHEHYYHGQLEIMTHSEVAAFYRQVAARAILLAAHEERIAAIPIDLGDPVLWKRPTPENP